MNTDIDSLLDRVRTVSHELDALGADDPRRSTLEAERNRLRDEARRLAAGRRNPVSVEREIVMLEDRLAEIDELRIKPGYSEKHLGRTVQDPGAYRYTINRAIDADHETEIADIEDRLARLRPLAEQHARDTSGEESS